MTVQQLHDALTLLPDDLILETDRRRSRGKRVIPWKHYAAMAACFALVLSASLFCMRLISPKGAAETAQAPAAASSLGGASAQNENQAAVPKESNEYEKEATVELETRAAAEGRSITGGSGEWEEAAPEEPGENGSGAPANAAFSVETPRHRNGTACYTSDPRVTLVCSMGELEEYFTHYDYQYRFDNIGETCGALDESWFQSYDLVLIAVHSVPVGSGCEITSVTEEDGHWEICAVRGAFDPENPETTDWHLFLPVEKAQIPDKEAITLILDTPEG